MIKIREGMIRRLKRITVFIGLMLYLNPGITQFGEQITINENYRLNELQIADIDRNGLDDLFSDMVVHLNVGGAFTMVNKHESTFEFGFQDNMLIGQFDQDSVLEILAMNKDKGLLVNYFEDTRILVGKEVDIDLTAIHQSNSYTADLDGDGRDEIYVKFFDKIEIYQLDSAQMNLNWKGEVTFQEDYSLIGLDDYDLDGNLDYVIFDESSSSINIYEGNGLSDKGGLISKIDVGTKIRNDNFNFFDIDGDGIGEVCVNSPQLDSLIIYSFLTDHLTVTWRQSYFARDFIGFFDMNLDSIPDMVLTNEYDDRKPIYVYFGNSDGTYGQVIRLYNGEDLFEYDGDDFEYIGIRLNNPGLNDLVLISESFIYRFPKVQGSIYKYPKWEYCAANFIFPKPLLTIHDFNGDGLYDIQLSINDCKLLLELNSDNSYSCSNSNFHWGYYSNFFGDDKIEHTDGWGVHYGDDVHYGNHYFEINNGAIYEVGNMDNDKYDEIVLRRNDSFFLVNIHAVNDFTETFVLHCACNPIIYDLDKDGLADFYYGSGDYHIFMNRESYFEEKKFNIQQFNGKFVHLDDRLHFVRPYTDKLLYSEFDLNTGAQMMVETLKVNGFISEILIENFLDTIPGDEMLVYANHWNVASVYNGKQVNLSLSTDVNGEIIDVNKDGLVDVVQNNPRRIWFNDNGTLHPTEEIALIGWKSKESGFKESAKDGYFEYYSHEASALDIMFMSDSIFEYKSVSHTFDLSDIPDAKMTFGDITRDGITDIIFYSNYEYQILVGDTTAAKGYVPGPNHYFGHSGVSNLKIFEMKKSGNLNSIYEKDGLVLADLTYSPSDTSITLNVLYTYMGPGNEILNSNSKIIALSSGAKESFVIITNRNEVLFFNEISSSPIVQNLGVVGLNIVEFSIDYNQDSFDDILLLNRKNTSHREIRFYRNEGDSLVLSPGYGMLRRDEAVWNTGNYNKIGGEDILTSRGIISIEKSGLIFSGHQFDEYEFTGSHDFDKDGIEEIILQKNQQGTFVVVNIEDYTNRFVKGTRFSAPFLSQLSSTFLYDMNRDGLRDLVFQKNQNIVQRINHSRIDSIAFSEEEVLVELPYDFLRLGNVGDLNCDSLPDLIFWANDVVEFIGYSLSNGSTFTMPKWISEENEGVPPSFSIFSFDNVRNQVIRRYTGKRIIMDGENCDTLVNVDTLYDNRTLRVHDINVDGLPDILLGPDVRYNLGNLNFAPPVPVNVPHRLREVFDIDGDLAQDIVAWENLNDTVFLLGSLNDGAGNFTVDVHLSYENKNGLIVKLADINNDSIADLLIREDEDYYFHIMSDDLTFLEDKHFVLRSDSRPRFELIEDIDGDGDKDIVISNYGTVIIPNLMSNNKIRTFYYYDKNGNSAADSGEIVIKYPKVNITPSHRIYKQVIEEYYNTAYLRGGDYKIEASQINFPWRFKKRVHSINFSLPVIDTLVHFKLEAEVDTLMHEVDVDHTRLRCFSQASIFINVKNNGSLTSNDSIFIRTDTLIFNPILHPFPDTTINNIHVYRIDSFCPFDEFVIELRGSLGNMLNTIPINVRIKSGSVDTSHNKSLIYDSTFFYDVRCSFDPNEKIVGPGEDPYKNYLNPDDEIYYKIYFQNTGNDTAYYVKIIDSLDSRFDLSNFDFISASHDCIVTLEDNKIIYEFNEVNLPDTGTNYLMSQGYVEFSMKMPDIEKGDSIPNKASIYFDQNAPIVTNKVLTYLNFHSDNHDNLEGYFQIYPNPFSNSLFIRSNFIREYNVRIFDTNGRLLFERESHLSQTEFDLSKLENGIYSIIIKDLNSDLEHFQTIIKL